MSDIQVTNDTIDSFSHLTTLIGEAQGVLEEIAAGGASVSEDIRAGYGHQIAILVEAIRDVATFVEDEMGKRLARADESEIEQLVNGWLDG